jgi:hypothetical protein
MQLCLDEILCNAPPRRRYIACLFRKTGATRSPRANNTLRAADGIQPCGTCVQLNFTRSNVRTAPVMVSVPIWSAALKRFFELLSLDAWAKWNPPLHRALQAPSRCLAANFRFRTWTKMSQRCCSANQRMPILTARAQTMYAKRGLGTESFLRTFQAAEWRAKKSDA